MSTEALQAMVTDIDVLIDLWVARFGNEWVDLIVIEEEPFFMTAYKRLKKDGALEMHYLTDRAKLVCRMAE
jgi:hypothetical protein